MRKAPAEAGAFERGEEKLLAAADQAKRAQREQRKHSRLGNLGLGLAGLGERCVIDGDLLVLHRGLAVRHDERAVRQNTRREGDVDQPLANQVALDLEYVNAEASR